MDIHPPPTRLSCLNLALFVGASLWAIGVSVLTQGGGWFADQIRLIEGQPDSWYFMPLISLLNGALLLVVLLPLALLTRAPRLRAAYWSWVLATGLLLLFALVRVLPRTWAQPAALAQSALCLLLLALTHRFATVGRPSTATAFVAPLLLVPWLLFGALGSPLDTLLGLLTALLFGALLARLLAQALFGPLREHTAGTNRDNTLGGYAAGIVLLIAGAGFGFGGTQLLLALCLPPLGFALATLGLSAKLPSTPSPSTQRIESWRPWRLGGSTSTTLLIAAGLAGPLLFVDPDELMLILGGGEILSWALRAAGLALLIGLGVSAALALSAGRLTPLPRSVALAGVAITWLVGLLLYALVGQLGFYGERLFVVLRDQADVAPLAATAGREQRLSAVFTRLTQHANTTQAGMHAALEGFGVAYTPYYLVNALEVRGGPFVYAYLTTRPEVDRILESPQLRPLPMLPASEPGSSPAPAEPPWNIRAIGADRVWDELGITGTGIVVGQSDSGVQGEHPALYAGYRGRNGQHDYNWFDPWGGTTAPTDHGGHGTHTLGTALGRGGIGVAPGAEWIGCVNLERNLGNPAYYLDCLQFMLAPFPQRGNPFTDGDPTRAAHVLNNSWGCPELEGCDAGVFVPAVRALRAAGIFVVASAGNEGPECSSVADPIAIYDEVFSVGAVDDAGDIADFSSRGPVTSDGSGRVKPDLVAPGVAVLSALPGNSYGPNDGTSMAGPHVAGAVALLWSANPQLIGDIERTEHMLIETTQPFSGDRSIGCFSGSQPSNAYGYGVLDAYAAVQAALAAR